jgi:hypothetical protein
MDFKYWLEIVEPLKPKTVKKKLTAQNKGTNTEKPMLQFQWKTSKGNDVKLQMTQKGNADYEVVFYVNDTLDDKAGGEQRDPEILSTVLYVLRKKVDSLNLERFSFRAYSSAADTKVIRNVPIDIKPALDQLNQFEHAIKIYTPIVLPHGPATISLYAKLNKPLPPQQLSFDRNAWLRWSETLKTTLNNLPKHEDGSDIDELINSLKASIGTGKFSVLKFNINILEKTLEHLSNNIKANSPKGWHRTNNRRTEIYSKLVHRNFPDWDVEISGDRFYLTKKSHA